MDHVLECLLEKHREIEEDAGEDPSLVTGGTMPIDGLAGFDSPLIPTVVRGLAKALGIDIPRGFRLKNPYIDASKRKLPLNDVAARFRELYCKEGAR